MKLEGGANSSGASHEKNWYRAHLATIALCLYIFLFSCLHICKPAFLYLPDGSYRQFGLGYVKKTAVPSWLVAILLALFCYLFVLSYTAAS